MLKLMGKKIFKILCYLNMWNRQYPRYRTLTIYNVFFEQNKMAEEGIRNTTTGDSVGVSCFYSNKGPSRILVKLCHCPDLVSAYDFCLIGLYV